MAKRTPLGTSSSFTVKPFDQAATEYHSYWGEYPYDATALPAPFFGRAADSGSAKLPNAPNNALAAPEFAKLQAGDTGATIELIASDGNFWGLWTCIYPGTVGGGDAVWVRLDNDQLAQQTIRDAHVIVVAQSGTLAPVYAVTPPPADRLNLGAAGDVVSITCDFLDTGNGAQLEAALGVAAAGGVPIDIRLRPCDIGMTGIVGTFFVLPGNCRLIGAGRTISKITGLTTGAQQILELNTGSEVIDLAITSPAPTASAGTGSEGVVFTSKQRTRLKNLKLTMLTTGVARLGARAMFLDTTASAEVLDCTFVGDSQFSSSLQSFPAVAIVMGPWASAVDLVKPTHDFEVSRCHFEGTSDTSSWQQALLSWNVAGTYTGRMSECEAFVSRPRLATWGAVGVTWAADAGSIADLALCPRLDDIRVIVADVSVGGEGGDGFYAGFVTDNRRNLHSAVMVTHRGLQVVFLQSGSTVDRVGVYVAADDGAKVEGGQITDQICANYTWGIWLDAKTGGKVTGQRITAADINAPVTTVVPGTGVVLNASGTGTIDDVGISNIRCNNIPVGGAGVNVSTANVSNTIILGNHLRPSPGTGTGILDAGTGTEAAHNIVL